MLNYDIIVKFENPGSEAYFAHAEKGMRLRLVLMVLTPVGTKKK